MSTLQKLASNLLSFDPETTKGVPFVAPEIDTDEQIVRKAFYYLTEEAKDDDENELALAKDFPEFSSFGFKAFIKQAHERLQVEWDAASTSEKQIFDNAIQATDEVIKVKAAVDKLWLDNWCLRNNKKLVTDPFQIAFYARKLKAVEEAEKRAEDALLQLEDDSLPEFPRLSGSLSDLADALYPDIPYGFKMMAAVTHFGLIRSGRDELEGCSSLQPRFYVCFIADAGHGKTAAINEVRTCMLPLKPRMMEVPSSIDSGPALVDQFAALDAMRPPLADVNADKAARVLLDPDEMSDLFEKSKVSAQSRNTLGKEFLKLFEANRTGNRIRKSSWQGENAHLAVLGGATPEGYKAMWTGTGGAASGLQSRFVLVTSDAKVPSRAQQQPSDQEALAAAVLRIGKQIALPGQTIRFDEDARSIFAEWSDSLGGKPSHTRVGDFASRLLIVLAVTNDVAVVNRDLVAQAIQFGNYVISVREKFDVADSYSFTQNFENDIIAVFKRYSESLSQNDVRRLVRPERKPGGMGPFNQAWVNLVKSGMLVQDGQTAKGKHKYRLV
jgi:hypothetical protein